MRKSEIAITLTGYGRESVRLTFDTEPTLDEVLEEAGWELHAGEKASVNGETADSSSILENGDTIQIVGKKDGGLK